ncbi:hypothetical protein [Pedobacter sp. MC2016-24]|uniref:hypothetical protein n=1 Tax=Pedobacter sp. MC2016-24 TaxID=2780090 RepID=UPI001881CBA6|nr:hypothetical protein [Pedobacter sp. MC2016-24]MBE9600019.1 hypothetical protein [Pedobacter sp. MC2016-24]
MPLEQLFLSIIKNDVQHARFLNTLSFMENAGARKISASEHPETVTTMILKHAAEEHRHAYYLKKQLEKIQAGICPTYALSELMAPQESRFFLHKLDVYTSRYLKNKLGLSGTELRYAAYLFVTYAIELRADELYPVYQQALTESNHKVTVKSIILEEAGHLEEMIAQLKHFSADWELHAAVILDIENSLFNAWIEALALAVKEVEVYA